MTRPHLSKMTSSVSAKSSENEVFLFQVDERAYYREDENSPYLLFLGTAIQIGLQSTVVVGAEDHPAQVTAVRRNNDRALFAAATYVAEQVETGVIAVFDAVSK